MKYTSKKLPDSVIEVEASLSHKEFLEYYQPVYDQALSNVKLKGFRSGSAPKDLADKAVDKEKVFNEAVSDAVRATLKEINQENDWQLIDQPKVEVLETNPSADLGVKFKATLTVFPKVKLGNYKKIAKHIMNEDWKGASVSEEEVEKSIKWALNSRAKFTRVQRVVRNGDMVDIDFSGFINGKPLDGASGKADNFILGEGKFINGFEENILNHKEGDKLEFSVDFPKDYWKEDLRDKKVDFKVSLKGVYDRKLPELNDEFVKGLGKFENVENFKKSVREGMKKEKEEREKEKTRLKIIDEIIKNSDIELPEIMVKRTLDNLIAEYKPFMKPGLGSEKEEDLKKELEQKAKHSVSTNLVLYQISKDEKLDPTPKEVEAEANKLLAGPQFSKGQKIDSQKIYDYSYGILQKKKVFDFLESSN